MEEHAEQFCSAWNCKARAGRRPNPSPSEGQRPGRRKARGWFSRPNGPTGLLRRVVGPLARKTTFSWPSRSRALPFAGRPDARSGLTCAARARNKFGINCHPCPVALLRRPTGSGLDTPNGGPAPVKPSWSHPGPRKIRGIWALGWKNTPNNFVPRGTAKRVRAEGPTHRPAKGNALEDGRQEDGFLGPTGQPVFSGEWLGRWPERPPSHGHLDPGRCPSLGDLTPVPGSHAPARARNKFGINCHPCPVALFAGPPGASMTRRMVGLRSVEPGWSHPTAPSPIPFSR